MRHKWKTGDSFYRDVFAISRLAESHITALICDQKVSRRNKFWKQNG